MSKRTTTIRVHVEGDVFVASCPHVPDSTYASAANVNDQRAVNELIRQVREYRKQYELDEQPVPWVETVEQTNADQTLHLTGLWPRETVAPEGVTTTDEISEESEAEDGN